MLAFGIIMPKGRYPAQKAIGSILEDAENNLPFLARELLNDLWRSNELPRAKAFRLVPTQYTTGGVVRLSRISKRGEKHIFTSLIHGARAVIVHCKNKTDRTNIWVKYLVERQEFRQATVALAAKNDRLI